MSTKSYKVRLPLDVADKLETLSDRLHVDPKQLIRLGMTDWLNVIPEVAESELSEQLKAIINKETDLTTKSDKIGDGWLSL